MNILAEATSWPEAFLPFGQLKCVRGPKTSTPDL